MLVLWTDIRELLFWFGVALLLHYTQHHCELQSCGYLLSPDHHVYCGYRADHPARASGSALVPAVSSQQQHLQQQQLHLVTALK